MANSKITVESLNLHYGENHALKNVNMEIADHAITAFIGPSGCGKSTFLRCLNRMNDLMDEPTSALDPISTLKIEELMETLKKKYTVVIVTHNMQQAARVSDDTAFFLVGEVIEKNATSEIFARPQDKRTEDYITGRFG